MKIEHCGWNGRNYGTRYIDSAKDINREISSIQRNAPGSGKFDAFKKILEYDESSWEEANPDRDTLEYDIVRNINLMYTAFKGQYDEEYEEEAIKSDFALCLCSAYKEISDKARKQSAELLKKIREAGIDLPDQKDIEGEEKV